MRRINVLARRNLPLVHFGTGRLGSWMDIVYTFEVWPLGYGSRRPELSAGL